MRGPVDPKNCMILYKRYAKHVQGYTKKNRTLDLAVLNRDGISVELQPISDIRYLASADIRYPIFGRRYIYLDLAVLNYNNWT